MKQPQPYLVAGRVVNAPKNVTQLFRLCLPYLLHSGSRPYGKLLLRLAFEEAACRGRFWPTEQDISLIIGDALLVWGSVKEKIDQELKVVFPERTKTLGEDFPRAYKDLRRGEDNE